MKSKIWIIPVLCMYLLLISASTTEVEKKPVVNESEVVAPAPAATEVHNTHKLNFFQRVLLKRALKHYKAEDISRADQQAKNSFIFGISGMGLLLAGLLANVPILVLLCIPAAIVAMVLGGNAIRGKTSQENKARLGKGLGLGTLIALGALLIVSLIWWAAFFNAL